MPNTPTSTTLLTGKPWVHSTQTDVQATWRRFGWVPAAERGTTQPQQVEVKNG